MKTRLNIVIIQGCLVITFIMASLVYFNDLILSFGIFGRVITTLVFGLGGIGIYLPFGYLIKFFTEKYMGESKNETNKRKHKTN